MPENTLDQQRSVALSNYEQLAAKLEQTTDPAQAVVLESCLAEIAKELEPLTPSS